MCKTTVLFSIMTLSAASAMEYHVSIKGHDADEGSAAKPLRTISAAARLAQPGDTITVHEGVYRERITPPRGGESDAKRITYQAAPGEQVIIKGSEIIRGWEKVANDTWKVRLPNPYFNGFNPYADRIHGDWFDPRGREHHTGAVYLNEHWLIEAPNRDDVLKPVGEATLTTGAYLLNVAWFKPAQRSPGAERIPATGFAAQRGVQTAACSEGGECIGFIEHGDWVRYEGVDFGERTEQLQIRAASDTRGGTIEIRLDSPDGELLGTCVVPRTGGWQSWASFVAPIKPVGGTRTLCLAFKARTPFTASGPLWFAEVDPTHTTIWAQFEDVDPNRAEVEINVRKAVFYPDAPRRDFITVRGFTMMHAATPWAPPTAEQVGLIGTHWSRGWIIEDNDVRYSTCVGIALGKYGDAFDNTSQNSAEGYVKTIERALENRWSGDAIGHHLIRNNRVAHCEQAGIVGSLGPIFSRITGNEIHDIHVRGLFSGAEMAGIKLHAAIDTEITGNHIHHSVQGIWLDWMAQGTRVSGNLLHDNAAQDLFVEVNHGPFLVDNNLFLSPTALLDMSEGGAYAHNLFAGRLNPRAELRRETPYHPPHTTQVAGLRNIRGGDDRFFNNIFAGHTGLAPYDAAALPMHLGGNVFLHGAAPCKAENNPLVLPAFDPGVMLVEEGEGLTLRITLDDAWRTARQRRLVTTDLLSRAAVPDLPYEQADGAPYRLDRDYLDVPRNREHPFPGPFEVSADGEIAMKVWPAKGR